MADLKIMRIKVGQMGANCYLVYDDSERICVLVDPGDDSGYITEKILELKLNPEAIIATHGHFDHIMGVFELQKTFNIPFLIHKNDEFLVKLVGSAAKHFLKTKDVFIPQIDGYLKGGDTFSTGSIRLDVIETPGHTPGGISLYSKSNSFVIVGDLIFKDGLVGRTDHSYSSKTNLKISIARILSLAKETRVYPGHGDATSVGDLVNTKEAAGV